MSSFHYIPRIHFDFSPPRTSWTVQRLQFPLGLAYTSTFHSCLGLTLDQVVLDVQTDVFAHGQLYTAISRVRNCCSIKLLFHAQQNSDSIRMSYTKISYLVPPNHLNAQRYPDLFYLKSSLIASCQRECHH